MCAFAISTLLYVCTCVDRLLVRFSFFLSSFFGVAIRCIIIGGGWITQAGRESP